MKFLRFLGNFLAILVMIVMFVWVIGAGVTDIAVKLAADDGITNLVSDADITDLLKDENGNKIELYDDIIRESGLSESMIDGVLNSTSFKKIMGYLLGSIVNYSLTGDDSVKISSVEFNKMMSDNIDNIVSDAGITLTETEKRNILSAVQNSGNGILNEAYSETIVSKSFDFKFIINNYLWIVVLVAILLFLIIALFRFSLRKALGDSGVVILTAGILFLLFGLLGSGEFINDLVINNVGEYGSFFGGLTACLGNMIFRNGLIMILVGIILVTISIVIKKLINKRRMNTVEGINNIDSVATDEEEKANNNNDSLEDFHTLKEDEVSTENLKENVSEDDNKKESIFLSDDTMEMKTFADRVQK